jgi:hypothetical protein
MRRGLIGVTFACVVAILAMASLLVGNGAQADDRPHPAAAADAGVLDNTQDDPPPTDSEAPSAPSQLLATSITLTAVSLAWQPATDNIGVVEYRLYERVRANPYLWLWILRLRDIVATEATIDGLEPGSLHRYAVIALDAAGNESARSSILQLYTYQAPATYHPISQGEQIYAIVGEPFRYQVAALGVPAPTFTLMVGPVGMTVDEQSGLVAWLPAEGDEGSVTTTVRAANLVGDDEHTVSFPVHPAGTDLTPPGPVANLTASDLTERGATLHWTAAVDNVGVAGYRIIAQVAGHGQGLFLAADTGAPVTTFVVATLQPGVSYRLWVAGYDTAGNVASISGLAPVQIMTLGAPPTATVTPTPTATSTGTPTATLAPTAAPTETPEPGVTVQLSVSPTTPTTSDLISITVAGVWPDSCTPDYAQHEVTGNLIALISALSTEPFCSPAEFPWGYTIDLGPLAAGDYTVTHTLDGSVTTIQFTVTPAGPTDAVPPFIYAGADNPPPIIIPGEPFSYNVEADGAPRPTFALQVAPAGMTIDPLSGRLSWTMTLQAAPIVTVTVIAVNEAGRDEHTYYLQTHAPEVATPGPQLLLPLVRR